MTAKYTEAPNPQLPIPSAVQLLLFVGLLGWLVIAPVLVGSLTPGLPAGWSSALLALLLLAPAGGLLGLAHRRNLRGLQPLALALLVTTLYITAATLIRVVARPDSPQETLLRLTALLLAALLVGGLGLRQTGVPGWMLSHAFGFDRPPLAGLLAGLGLIAIATVGWPLTGALGDSWESQLILVRALAVALPEEIFFRGAVLGIITFNFQHRKAFAALLALFIYVAFTPSQLVPHNQWSKLALLFTALPFALLMVELRALTGSIWPGTLFAWAYHAAPLLFTDPRDELRLLTYPWQGAAYVWLAIGAGGLALLLWLGRTFLATRWQPSRRGLVALAAGTALLAWGMWAGLWLGLGRPGFHNDGFLIIMAQQANVSQAQTMGDPLERRRFVRQRLIQTAQRSQAPVRAALDEAGLSYRPFYLINMIQVDGHYRRMDEFAALPGVARVMHNPNVRPYPVESSGIGYNDASTGQAGPGWNVTQIKAEAVWAMGITGQGIVVGGQDTGYDWTHPALDQAYRGAANGAVSHAYNWHDAWAGTVQPFDDDQHGTHTMGTIVGDDGTGNQIGVAPGAQWMGCRNMQRGLGNPASYAACLEFFLAPYPPGSNPFTGGDVSQAPHVVNNSWACPDREGCDDAVLQPALDALRAAGIMMIVSAGNAGPGCQTVTEPPALYDSVFSVGATGRGGNIAFFSSRGPAVLHERDSGDAPGEALLKPDISAPGARIRSSLPGGGYGLADGTSMAGPHVAGLAALLWSANPALIGQIEATEMIIRQSATATGVSGACPAGRQPSAEGSLLEQVEAMSNPTLCACGNVTGVPNNVYGWGEINALEAVKLALEWER